MTTKTEEFIQLIDRALATSSELLMKSGEKERLHNVINALEFIKTKTIAGTLEPSKGTATLGIARELADWIEPLNSPLLHAVGAIEGYYQKHL